MIAHVGETLFHAITYALEKNGRMMRGGTIVDATILNAPSSTKNASGEPDSEMYQTKKGNQWYFGMKAHIGVDTGSGYVHTVLATAANEHDISSTSALIREDDHVVYGDSGYIGIKKGEEISSAPHKSQIEYRINRRRGSILKQTSKIARYWEGQIERQKSSVRSKVEHPLWSKNL